ncbi:hypothetical protein GOD80_25895 [Sinorhizobium medicae]|nr:hypothetical protein [Sinorhizobium medicae]MDX0590159.1 hypothetical protein [Sinorhizobium medicae]MDX0808595.1 hypothetical protein [Sinorhizobium medicae]MDX2385072.1 hypothetical protein [Sinorhizobium medicae]
MATHDLWASWANVAGDLATWAANFPARLTVASPTPNSLAIIAAVDGGVFAAVERDGSF